MPAPRINASVIFADVRNFTPSLLASEHGKFLDDFISFMNKFYTECEEVCEMATPYKDRPRIHLQSTGDGFLGVFQGEDHCKSAFLAGLLLMHKLKPICEEWNRVRTLKGLENSNDTSFGIGIESGDIVKIEAVDEKKDTSLEGMRLKTYIGKCINVAARIVEAQKMFGSTYMLLSENCNDQLCGKLWGIKYNELVKDANVWRADPAANEAERERLWREMRAANDKLNVLYVGHLNLKGVKDPVGVYRVSSSLARVNRKEYWDLLRLLVPSGEQRKEISERMQKSVPGFDIT